MKTTLRHRLRILWMLFRYWSKHPEWRLGQLIVNTSLVPDAFYNPDENFVRRWQRGLDAKGSKKK